MSIILACCALALVAQDGIRVNYKGANPTISDFVTAFVTSSDNVDEEDCCADEAFNAIGYVWEKYQKGIPLEEGQTLTLDEKNGFVLYESRSEYDSTENLVRMEMCYWNENDGKHKLFAFNDMASFSQDGPLYSETSQLTFLRYDDSTRHMTYCDAPGFDVYDGNVTYSLPQTGKDIIVTRWNEDGSIVKTPLKWNGHKFIK